MDEPTTIENFVVDIIMVIMVNDIIPGMAQELAVVMKN